MKKVLFVITKSNWGGAQRYVFDMATGLKRDAQENQYEISVALGGNGELAEKLKEAGIPVYPILSLGRDINAGNDLSAFFELLSIIKKVHPDVVHLNSSKIGGLGALAARLHGVRRIIFTAHGWAFNEERSTLSKFALKCAYWITILLCSHTIAVSEATKKSVSSWLFIGKKISVVHNAVSQINFLSREESRRELHLDQDSWILGTIAELHPIKGLIYACKAISELAEVHSNIKYAIIGEGENRNMLENYINEKNLDKKIILIGHKSEAAQYLKAFDAFILPSLSEGLGYVVLEAGLASLPVIASNVGGIPEIITDDITGLLVPAQDTISIMHALETIYSDHKEADELGVKLNEEVRIKFSMQTMLEKTSALY